MASTLAELSTRLTPVTLAGEQRIPVLDGLTSVVPGGGLQRGSSIAVTGVASTSLMLALVAGAAEAGSWVAVVGVPTLGLAAASELGVPLDRMVLVDTPPPGQWASVVAALFDAFDVVVTAPSHSVSHRDGRRLQARSRERGSVMVQLGEATNSAGGPADLAFDVTRSEWFGLGEGHGVLACRRVEVRVAGRRLGGSVSHQLWLPGRGATVEVANEAPVVSISDRRQVAATPRSAS